MARITIASLTTQLEAAHVAYERLAIERDALRADLESARMGLDVLQECYDQAEKSLLAALRNTAPVRAVPQRRGDTPEVLARRAAMAAARDEAMRTGRCVTARMLS